MPINYSSGQSIRSGARAIHVVDSRGGCPGAYTAGAILISLTFTTTNTALVYAQGSMISAAANRRDLQMYINGVNSSIQCIQNTGPTSTWDDRGNIWTGTVAAGTHTIDMRSGYANIWGCGGSWGRLSALVWEVS